MSGYELRPLGLGELLDRAFLLYRKHFWLFVGIMAFPSCLILPMQFLLLRARGVPFPWDRPSPQSHVLAFTYGYLLIYWFIYVVVQAATTFGVANAYLGQPSTVRDAYGKIRGRFWRMISVAIGVGIRVFGLIFLAVILAAAAGGTIVAVSSRGNTIPPTFSILIIVALVLGGIAAALWFSLRYAVSLPAVLLEDIKGRDAIRRSVELSRGRRGQIFIAILLGVVITYAMAFLSQGPFYAGIALMKMKGQLPIGLILAMSASSTVGGAIAGPLLMIILVLLYYDLRIRKEAFDLHQMIASLPEPNPAESRSLT